MAKLHKRPPGAMSSFPQTHSPSASQGPSLRPSNSWDIWYPSSPNLNTVQKDACPTSSFVSRTMSYARGQISSPDNYARKSSYVNDMTRLFHRSPDAAVANSNPHQISPHPHYRSNSSYDPAPSYESVPAPRTEGERYWAYRAIVAEVKLAERMGVRADELERLKEELRRQSTCGTSRSYYEERERRLERLALGLISTIILITLILLFRHHSSPDDRPSKNRAFRPHLTIPILSPFTSIVEHEDSKFGFRTTAAFLIVLGCVVYAMFRHWLRQRPR
ncbi:hypothetical protein ACEPAF_2890 [Sanghuangporus sanghuang]